MSTMEAVRLARRGIPVTEIAERCGMTINAATAIAEPMGRQRIKDMEASIRELRNCFDRVVELHAELHAAHKLYTEKLDRLSVRVSTAVTQAEKLLPQKRAALVQGGKKRKKKAQ